MTASQSDSKPDFTPQDLPCNQASTIDIEDLIDRFQLKIWRYLRGLGCDDALADDLTQDTFVAIIRRPMEYLSDAATSVYLRRVAYHLLIDFQRRNRRVHLSPDIDQNHMLWMRWAGHDNESEIFEYLKTCFDRLTDRAQMSLMMRFSKSASREEIAEALAISQNGAKNLMQRAKNQLKDCVQSRIDTAETNS